MSQFFLQGSDLLVLNAAGYDEIEIIQVRIHIECEAMHRDPTTAAHSDRADLPLTARYMRIKSDTGLSR